MNDFECARLAVDKAKLSFSEPNLAHPRPKVGVAISKEGILLGWASRGIGGECLVDQQMLGFEAKPGEHAEQSLISRLSADQLIGAFIYCTLEPCTSRKKGASCAELIINSGITKVFIGNFDPNPDIGTLAWRAFHANNVVVRDFPGDLRNEARHDNAAFFSKFEISRKVEDGASFDYLINDGIRRLGPEGSEITTKWGEAGNGTIWAYDSNSQGVTIAKNCKEFTEIDDPGSWFADKHYYKGVKEGEIVIFKNERGYALVKVEEVKCRKDGINARLKFRYQLRYPE